MENGLIKAVNIVPIGLIDGVQRPWWAQSGIYPQQAVGQVDRGFCLDTLVLLAVLRSGAQRNSTLQPVVNVNQSF